MKKKLNQKKYRNKKELFPIILIIIFIPFYIILSNVDSIAFNEKSYFKELQKIPSEIQEKQEITSNLISYLKYQEDTSLISDFSEAEQSHLKDVKGLLNLNKQVLKAMFLILLSAFILIFYLKKNIIKNISISLIFGGIATDVLLIILAIVSINFNFAFALFHKMLFPQGNWIFSPDSLLIRLFPIEFFTGIAKAIFLNSFLIANILILIGILLFRIKKRKK